MKIIPCKYNTKICPNCGQPAQHPQTGLMTPEKWEIENTTHCTITEDIDEGRNTIGYSIICHN